MREYQRGVQVEVRCLLTDQVGHRPRYQAIVAYLRRNGAAGATVIRGIAGFTGEGGRVSSASPLHLSHAVPLVITWVDTPDQVVRLLPGLRELAGSAPVTVCEVEASMSITGDTSRP